MSVSMCHLPLEFPTKWKRRFDSGGGHRLPSIFFWVLRVKWIAFLVSVPTLLTTACSFHEICDYKVVLLYELSNIRERYVDIHSSWSSWSECSQNYFRLKVSSYLFWGYCCSNIHLSCFCYWSFPGPRYYLSKVADRVQFWLFVFDEWHNVNKYFLLV